MQQNFILLKTFCNIKKVQNNSDCQNADRLKKLPGLSFALKKFVILISKRSRKQTEDNNNNLETSSSNNIYFFLVVNMLENMISYNLKIKIIEKRQSRQNRKAERQKETK